MKRPIVIFGAGDIAELAHYYFTRDSAHDVAAFTVDGAFLTRDRLAGLPVVPFETLAEQFPPDAHAAFVALSYSRLNELRRQKYLALKALGYDLVSYLSSKATLLNDGRIGENCFILEHNVVQPFATIGNNVTLWSGNHIGHHSRIADHCFLASHIVVSGGVDIGEACFIGVNATLRDHIRVGEQCVIGAGALILADAAPEGVYLGGETERSKVPSSRLRRI
ncbi:acetyltransferase [Mesorhizobium sp. MSK_1335]|uniref:Acetyltransferase n=1 Tax=Mesorhizobium montanum TaxID=3072323 RepID=A0ABU4ZIL6_9HYPH|nr:acetyltransferase [Mesorhizobium sp. MSK_1335]MDX8524184.1 acetyltransferase [Mesorhizobium sp. MSK_1335]